MKLLQRCLLAALLVLTMAGCSDSSREPLRLGTNVWPGYEPLYLAEDMGWLPESVKLVELVDASQVIRAFRSGSLDAAGLTLDEVLLLEQDNIPVSIVAVMDISEGADVILARPDIERFADLKGHYIAVESSALGGYMLTRALELNGMQLSDVSVAHRSVDDHEGAYMSGEVAAVVNFEPVRSRLLAAGARELFTSREIPGEIIDVLVVHNDYLKENSEQVQSLVNGWFKAVAMMREEPGEAMAGMAARGRLGDDPEAILAQYEGLRLPDREANQRMLAEGGDVQATIERLGENMLEQRLLRRTPLTRIHTDRYVR